MKLMLASKAPEDLRTLRYPVLVSPKLDGIRAYLGPDANVYTRNNKRIANELLNSKLWLLPQLGELDGELICGSPTAKDCFQSTTTAVMSKKRLPDSVIVATKFYVFDCLDVTLPFKERLSCAADRIRKLYLTDTDGVVIVPHNMVYNEDQLLAWEDNYLEQGYEGLMIRDPDGPYKNGRSTTKEGYLLKLKRFEDSEAVVISVFEEQHNANEKGADGKRSSKKSGKSGKGRLGGITVEWVNPNTRETLVFDIGTGFTTEQREKWWGADILINKVAKFKYFAKSGMKDAPRFPVFLGWREDI
jgi:DNA ligase-1